MAGVISQGGKYVGFFVNVCLFRTDLWLVKISHVIENRMRTLQSIRRSAAGVHAEDVKMDDDVRSLVMQVMTV